MSGMMHREMIRRECRERDEELLMYVHREQSPIARRRTRLHLRRCPACQERVLQLTQVSMAFADVIRGDELPSWHPPRPGANLWGAFLASRFPLIIGLIVAALITATIYRRTAENAWPGSSLIQSIRDACDLDIQRALESAAQSKSKAK